MVTCIRNVRSGQRIPKRKVTETKGRDDNKGKIAGELDLLDHHVKVRNFVKRRQTRILVSFHLPGPLPSESALFSQQLFGSFRLLTKNLELFWGFTSPTTITIVPEIFILSTIQDSLCHCLK